MCGQKVLEQQIGPNLGKLPIYSMLISNKMDVI